MLVKYIVLKFRILYFFHIFFFFEFWIYSIHFMQTIKSVSFSSGNFINLFEIYNQNEIYNLNHCFIFLLIKYLKVSSVSSKIFLAAANQTFEDICDIILTSVRHNALLGIWVYISYTSFNVWMVTIQTYESYGKHTYL